MSAPKEYTAREIVAAHREAVDRVVEWVFAEVRKLGGIEHVDARQLADMLYPLPKISQPRVVADPEQSNFEFRVSHSEMEERRIDCGAEWERAEGWVITRKRVELWADLFENPNELVDDDGSAQ